MSKSLRILLMMALFVGFGFIPHTKAKSSNKKPLTKRNAAQSQAQAISSDNKSQRTKKIARLKAKTEPKETADANFDISQERHQKPSPITSTNYILKQKKRYERMKAKAASKEVTAADVDVSQKSKQQSSLTNQKKFIAKKKSRLKSESQEISSDNNLQRKRRFKRSKANNETEVQAKTSTSFLAKKRGIARLRAKNKSKDVVEEIKIATDNTAQVESKEPELMSKQEMKMWLKKNKDRVATKPRIAKTFFDIFAKQTGKVARLKAKKKSEGETDKEFLAQLDEEIIEFFPNDFETKDIATTTQYKKKHKRRRVKTNETEEKTYYQSPKRKKHRLESAQTCQEMKSIDYQPISNIIIILSEKFYAENRLELLDSAIFFDDTVHRIRIDYSTMDTLTMWESRKILVDVVEDLLSELNGNGEVMALVGNAPLTPYDFEIVVHMGSYYTHILDLQSMGLITLKKGIAHYIASQAFNDDHTDCWDKRSETYEQSKNFVFSKREGENLYRPKKDEKASYFGLERYKPSDKDKRIMY